MVIHKTLSSPELAPREAALNMVLLVEHEKDSGRSSKRELYFGVYRSRSFIVITRSTSLLERIKRYIQWLIGFISYRQDAINSLAARSRKHWVPANQLEAAQKQLAKARLAEEKLQKTELDLRNQRQANANWRNAYQQAQTARALYENLHREMQNQEDAKDQSVIQKQQRINALERELGTLRNEHITEIRNLKQNWKREWDNAADEAKMMVIQARQKTVAKDKELEARDKKIKQLQAQIAQMRQTPATPAAAVGPPPQMIPAVASNSDEQDVPHSQ